MSVSSAASAAVTSVWGDPRLTWFLTRSLGVVLLVLLTVVAVLGTVLSGRPAPGRLPGFVVADLHRRLTVLALVLLVGHVTTAVADSYVTITWLDAVVPFLTTYRPLWTGLGTLACDVLLLVAVTSGLRHRMTARGWRAAHLSAYTMWPLAVLHTLGDGSDARTAWLPLLSLGCMLAVVVAGWWRLQRVEAFAGRVRLATMVAVPSVLVALIAWAWLGPLASGWAQRAGTPPPPGTGQPAAAGDAGASQ